MHGKALFLTAGARGEEGGRTRLLAYDLAGRLHSLLAVTSRVLKEIAGMPASAPPFLDPQAGGMSNIYLVGTRAVAAADLV